MPGSVNVNYHFRILPAKWRYGCLQFSAYVKFKITDNNVFHACAFADFYYFFTQQVSLGKQFFAMYIHIFSGFCQPEAAFPALQKFYTQFILKCFYLLWNSGLWNIVTFCRFCKTVTFNNHYKIPDLFQ